MSLIKPSFFRYIFLLTTFTRMATETLEMHRGGVHRIHLQSRGSSGLQLLYRFEKDSIVEISRVETQAAEIDKSAPDYLGSPAPATFEMKALEAGESKVTFY